MIYCVIYFLMLLALLACCLVIKLSTIIFGSVLLLIVGHKVQQLARPSMLNLSEFCWQLFFFFLQELLVLEIADSIPVFACLKTCLILSYFVVWQCQLYHCGLLLCLPLMLSFRSF